MLEREARVFNIQKYSLYDGPGVRTLIFFQGCPLQCKWCSNPEGLSMQSTLMYKKDACKHCNKCLQACPKGIHKLKDGKHYIDRTINCDACKKCEKACYASALKVMGEDIKISELMEVIEEDRMFYETSGGGMTLGGGEVLVQAAAALDLLKASKLAGINTAMETCGYTTKETILKVAEYTDLFLYDLKHMDSNKHDYWTGVRNEKILENLRLLLENGFNIRVRFPIIKGVNDDQDTLEKLMNFLLPYKDYENLKGIDILPYHKLGVNKYRQLDMEYPIKGDMSLDENKLTEIESWINGFDLPARVIKH